MIDPYVVVYIRPLFKVKTKVIDNNLNPVWDETFELIAEDKETQAIIFEVFVLWPFLYICFFISNSFGALIYVDSTELYCILCLHSQQITRRDID